MHILHIKLSPYKIAIAVYERGLACPYRLYLRTGKDYSGRIIIYKLVLKTGTFVFYLYFTFCFRHNGTNVVKKTNFV